VGTKNRFLDDRLQANLSLFDMKYDGYQASQFTQVISGNASGIFNAGDASDYGAEAEFIVLIDPETKFDIDATLLHAKFTSGTAVDSSLSAAPVALQSPLLDGNYLPNAPTVSTHAGLEHTFLAMAGGNWSARIEGKYQSRFYFDIFNHPDTSQKAYALGDASLLYTPQKGHWDAMAYVRNFANTAVLADATRNTTFIANEYEFAPPRTYGIKVSAHF
jgi:iron complex outermembrane receptor protein